MSKFKKNDHVRNLEGIEGIVTEVFISYPTLNGLADWSAPQVHYRVSFGVNCSNLYVDWELNDIRQGQLDLGDYIWPGNGAANEEDYWNKWYV